LTQYLYLLPYLPYALLALLWVRQQRRWPLSSDRIFTTVVTVAAAAIAWGLGWFIESPWIAGTIVAAVVVVAFELLTWYVGRNTYTYEPDEEDHFAYGEQS